MCQGGSTKTFQLLIFSFAECTSCMYPKCFNSTLTVHSGLADKATGTTAGSAGGTGTTGTGMGTDTTGTGRTI